MIKSNSSARILAVRCTASDLVVSLSDGREISTPLSWYPRLQKASEKERNNWRISPFGVHWQDLDEDLSLAGMLSGQMEQPQKVLETSLGPGLEHIEGQKDQRWSFAYGNLAADREISPGTLDKLHDEIEIAVDDCR